MTRESTCVATPHCVSLGATPIAPNGIKKQTGCTAQPEGIELAMRLDKAEGEMWYAAGQSHVGKQTTPPHLLSQ